MNLFKQSFYLRVVLTIPLCLRTAICDDNCHHKLTRPELPRFRCVTESEVYTDIIGIEQHMCTYQCIRRNDCSIINYNTEKNTCHLSNDPCVALEGDDTFQVNNLGLFHRSECLRWLPTSSFENSETVISPDCHHLETVCYVGRLISSTNILPGKYMRESDKVGTVFNGNEVTHIHFSSIKETLDVRPGCQLTWMPFSAGDVIPTGAVEGGFLESNGATLYVIRAPAGPRTAIFGYYDPASNSGYVPHFGPVLVIEMELLVLLWSVTHLMRKHHQYMHL